MTLWDLNEEQSAQIAGFAPELSQSFLVRLQELGFVVGAPVKCVKRTPFRAPRVFEVPGGVFTLEKNAADSIKLG